MAALSTKISGTEWNLRERILALETSSLFQQDYGIDNVDLTSFIASNSGTKVITFLSGSTFRNSPYPNDSGQVFATVNSNVEIIILSENSTQTPAVKAFQWYDTSGAVYYGFVNSGVITWKRLDGKQDLITLPTNNNIVTTDANGQSKDSGKKFNDSGTTINDIWTASKTKSYSDSLVVGLWDDRGSYNASGNVFPSSGGSGTAGAILKGDIWTISVAGTLGGSVVEAGDTVRALVDTPGSTATNWGILQNNIGYTPENQSNKDATGGYAGLTLFKINFKNALNTFTSFFTNSNTAARTYTFQDRDGTIADNTDLNLKINLANGSFNAFTGKTTIVDADILTGENSANSFSKIKILVSDLWTYISTKSGTFTNKILSDSTTYFGNVSDSTKKFIFSLGGATTAKTLTLLSSHTNDRTITLPDATTTLVGTDTTQTLTNKSIVATQLTGTLQAGQFPALTGDLTNTAGTLATTIANNAVTNAKSAQVATATIKGRVTASTGNVEDLTATQATSILNVFTGDAGSGGLKGLVTAPVTGDATKFLKGDGTWANDSTKQNLISSPVANNISLMDGSGQTITSTKAFKDTLSGSETNLEKQAIIPNLFQVTSLSGTGDKYKTSTSTTINASSSSVSSTPITITVDTGLSYANGQGIVLAVNPSLDSKFLATVQAYNTVTGSMDVVLYKYLSGATNGNQNSWTIYLDTDSSAYLTKITDGEENQILLRDANGDAISSGSTIIINSTLTSQSQGTNDQVPTALGLEDRIQSSLVNTNRISPVLDIVTAPPSNPIVGEAYLINGTGTGAFTSQNNKIAKFNNSKVDGGNTPWTFVTPTSGNRVIVLTGTNAGSVFNYNGSSWNLINSTTVPTGIISPFYGTTIPTGYLLCNGSTFDASTYAALNTFLGGNTLPDLRGRFLRGKTNGRTSGNGGDTNGELSIGAQVTDQLGIHSHTVTDPGHKHFQNCAFNTLSSAAFGSYTGAYFFGNAPYAFETQVSYSSLTINNAGGNETNPRYTVVNYIIRA